MSDASPGQEQPARRTRLADGDDLAIANPEDFEIERDETGEIIPEKQRVPGTETALLVRPMPPGAFNKWLPVLEGDDEDTEKQAEVISEYVVEPESLANATPEYLENDIRGGVVGGILQAIRNSAGYEVFRSVREQTVEETAMLFRNFEIDDLVEMTDSLDEDVGRR